MPTYRDALKIFNDSGCEPRTLTKQVKEELISAGIERDLTATEVCRLFKLYCLGFDAVDEMVMFLD